MQNLAEFWVQRCKWGHPDHSQFHQFAGTGQNIAAMYGKVPTYVELATLWRNEVVNYTYANNNCKSVCGHYKQVSNVTPTLYVFIKLICHHAHFSPFNLNKEKAMIVNE